MTIPPTPTLYGELEARAKQIVRSLTVRKNFIFANQAQAEAVALSALLEAADALSSKDAALRKAISAIRGSGNASGTWMDCVGPLIARFEIAGKFNADAVHNGVGAEAIAELMRSMATRLDRACEIARTALNPEAPHE